MISKEALQMIADNPRGFLQQGRAIERQIQVKNLRIGRLRQISVQITTTIKAASAYTGPGDKVGDCVTEILDLTKELETEVSRLLEKQQEIQAAINLLIEDATQKAILEAKYVVGVSWETIAYEFHYAYRWVMRLHKRALKVMQETAKKRLEE